MTIERNPQPVFASLWAIWVSNVLAAVLMPGAPLYGLLVLLAFFAIEIPAAFLPSGGARDTLSELATWVQRHTSKHRRFARGWNAALLAGIVLIAWLTGRTITTYAGTYGIALGLIVGVLLVAFLWDHFVNPQEHG